MFLLSDGSAAFPRMTEDALATPRLLPYLRAAWRQRDLAILLALNDHRAENQGLRLGRIWHLLSPILRIGVYGLIFGLLLSDRRPGGFLAFLSIGMFVFGLMQAVIQRGGTVFDARQGLLTSLYFPRVLLPVSVALRQLLDFRFEAVVMVLVILVTGQDITLGWIPFLGLVVPMALLCSIGGALVVAPVVAAVRDVTNLLPVLFRLAFYVSGVLFPIGSLLDDHPAVALLPVNPFYVYITLSRHLLLSPEPTATTLWAAAVAWAVLPTLAGTVVFLRREDRLVRT